MVAATRFGVRVREASEMRRVALSAGILFLTFGFGGFLLQATSRDLLSHPDAHLAMQIATSVIGLLTVLWGLLVSAAGLERWWAPGVLALLAASVPGLALALAFTNYPDSGVIAIAYPIIAIFGFYVLARWLAAMVVASIVVGQGVVEAASDSPWPMWIVLLWVALALMAVGYLTGELIDQLEQSRDAERRTSAELADLNANLESKVAEQVDEVERLGRLRRFLSAPVAEAVLESKNELRLAPHRREIAVLFCDLRGFTAFTKQVEPEEVMEVLDAYYAAAGAQISAFQATLGSFEGDGLMAYLNDPVPCDEPARRVVEMGLAISDAIDELTPAWQRRGYDLSYGIGMALGHATLGIVGYDGRNDYTAMGTVVNLGSRLCSTANARELVVDRRLFLQTEDVFTFTRREPVTLKGFGEPVANYLVDRR
jgi:class 3 adenylate cyclase